MGYLLLCRNSILKQENQNLHFGLFDHLSSLGWNKNLIYTSSFPARTNCYKTPDFTVTLDLMSQLDFISKLLNISYTQMLQVSLSELHWCTQQMHQYQQRLIIDHRQQLKARPTQTQCSLMQQKMWQVPTGKLVYCFKEKNLRLQVPSFAHGKNISPTTNYLNIKYQFNIRSVQNQMKKKCIGKNES